MKILLIIILIVTVGWGSNIDDLNSFCPPEPSCRSYERAELNEGVSYTVCRGANCTTCYQKVCKCIPNYPQCADTTLATTTSPTRTTETTTDTGTPYYNEIYPPEERPREYPDDRYMECSLGSLMDSIPGANYTEAEDGTKQTGCYEHEIPITVGNTVCCECPISHPIGTGRCGSNIRGISGGTTQTPTTTGGETIPIVTTEGETTPIGTTQDETTPMDMETTSE